MTQIIIDVTGRGILNFNICCCWNGNDNIEHVLFDKFSAQRTQFKTVTIAMFGALSWLSIFYDQHLTREIDLASQACE